MSSEESAVLAGGCFWCTEAVFRELSGVSKVEPGYSGGKVTNPSYEQVCTGRTGHAEAARITFDPNRISYKEILEVFFATHDPTSLNRQGSDVGTQYRSAVFCQGEEQRRVAEGLVKQLTDEKVFGKPIVTEIAPLQAFYPAEDYHREYFKRNPYQPYCQVVIAPKMAKFRAHFKEKISATPQG